jgi:hypothetical protein
MYLRFVVGIPLPSPAGLTHLPEQLARSYFSEIADAVTRKSL